MTSQILVTGATGNVGREVVNALAQKQVAVRVAARNVDAAHHAFGDEVKFIAFDFLDPATFANAFNGIKTLFLVRPPALSNVARDIAPAIHAAIRAGVTHIVFLSLQGVEQNRVTPHYKIEQLLKSSGVAYTFLRCGFFMQNLSTTHAAGIRDRNEIALPVGKAKTSFIDVRDIGAVGARVLTESGHENLAYTLTGSEALDYNRVAAILTAVLDRSIRYTDPSVIRFIRNEVANGHPWQYALLMTALYTITRFGNASEVTPDVARLLGRSPITFEQFAHDYRDTWV